MKILIAILIFSLIVIFHELGHFLLAKANGIRVNEFCLGLGPTIFGITKGETKYSLKLLPFGGACMMEGEDVESEDNRAFGKKSVWARISVVAAGPIFNFIMAFVFAVILLFNTGYTLPKISGIIDDYPAQEAGMQAGDIIIKLDQKQIHFFKEINSFMQFHTNEPVTVTYERDGVRYETELTPLFNEKEGRYMYGFIGTSEPERGNFFEVLKYSVYEVKYWISVTLDGLKSLLIGSVSVNDLSGPVGIVNIIGEGYEAAVSHGVGAVILQMLYMCIFLSANLGVMNLLPIPALDGGRLIFLIIEAVRGKKINPDKEGFVHFIGLMILLALMVLIMFNDIRKIFI